LEIFLYDGTSTTQLTNNDLLHDIAPQINDNGWVVWGGQDGSDYEIFLATPSSGYSATANAEASVYSLGSVTASGTFNGLTLILIPLGAVIALRIWRRKR
jgi:hypothetical protein